MDASRESLLVYWLHLIIIFGAFWGGKSFADMIGNNMNTIEATGAAIFLISLMILAAKLWGRTKIKYPKIASVGVRVFAAVLILIFFIS